jgi:hypothetical protein
MLNLRTLSASRIVLLMDFNVHAKDVTLKPTKPAHLLPHSRDIRMASRSKTTRTSITHESVRCRYSRRDWLKLVSLLDTVLHQRVPAQVFTTQSHRVVDEKLNVGCIRYGGPGDHGIMDLMEDKVHDIKSVVPFLSSITSTLIAEVHKIHKGSPESIIVTTTWTNGGPKEPEQLTVDGKQSLGKTNCSR